MWSRRSEKTGNSEEHDKVFWMWKRRAQKVGVPTKEREKERRSGTTTKSMGKGEGAQQSKGAILKGSSNVHGGVDNTQRSSNICGV